MVQREVWTQLVATYEPGTLATSHPFEVGDKVYIRRHHVQTLEPCWKGPYMVLLTTPTAVKVDGMAAWIHASHMKPAPPEVEDADLPQWRAHTSSTPLKQRLSRKQD